MVLPIYTYGQPVLRQRAVEVESAHADLQTLADDMIETMRGAAGIGLAAPQVGHSVRLVVVDLTTMDDLPEGGVPSADATGALVLVNPQILPDEASDLVDFEEGCLSIPDLRETVVRPDRLTLRWLDRRFQAHETLAEGMLARVVQHEMDHLDGVLFVDRISPLRKRLAQRRLRQMARGAVEADYPILPPD